MIIAHNSPRTPLYGTLTNPRIILDATGLRYNTNNGYGNVSGPTLTSWKSIAPGTVTETFDATAASGFTGLVNTLRVQDGYVEFPGKVMMGAQTGGNFNFMQYNAVVANMKYTVHMVLKVGQEAAPNWIYAFMGNFANSQGNKGYGTYYLDRIDQSFSDGLVSAVTRAVGGTPVINNVPQDLITPNVPFVYTEETDMSQVAALRRKHYINDVLFAYTAVSPSTAVVTGPSFTMEIGGIGNNLNMHFRGWISHIVIQEAIESSGTRTAFINSLLPYTKKASSNYFYDVDESITYRVYNTLNVATKYYNCQGFLMSPTDPNKLIRIVALADDHFGTNEKVIGYFSTNKGRDFASPIDLFDPAINAGDGEWGWSSDGVIHGLVDSHTTAGTAGGTNAVSYIYSTNEFGTSPTVTDITSQLPSNGLLGWRAHGNIIEVNGYLYATLTMFTDEGDLTNNAVYLMRKPMGTGTTWSFLQVFSGPAATLFLNEACVVKLSNNMLLMMVRNETTEEFRMYRIGTDFSTITDDGNQSFGETWAYGSPPQLTRFRMHPLHFPDQAEDVIAFWMQDRDAESLKVIFGRASAIESSGAAGFISGTKYTVATDTQILHYGRVVHPNNTFNSLGCFARDPGTLVENTLITFHGDASRFFQTRALLWP